MDADFSKAGDAYGRNLGDPRRRPNPCLGRIETPPIHAVRICPADIGTSTGLVTDEHARMLAAGGRPVAGLYAAGNDRSRTAATR